jgi:hypothetical protein
MESHPKRIRGRLIENLDLIYPAGHGARVRAPCFKEAADRIPIAIGGKFMRDFGMLQDDNALPDAGLGQSAFLAELDIAHSGRPDPAGLRKGYVLVHDTCGSHGVRQQSTGK